MTNCVLRHFEKGGVMHTIKMDKSGTGSATGTEISYNEIRDSARTDGASCSGIYIKTQVIKVSPANGELMLDDDADSYTSYDFT